MCIKKIINLGPKGFSDIYRGSEFRRYGDTSIIDQNLVLNFSTKKHRYFQDAIKSAKNESSDNSSNSEYISGVSEDILKA